MFRVSCAGLTPFPNKFSSGSFSVYVGLGGVPYYQARLAFGGLYFIMFLYAAGWRNLARSEGPGLLIPAALLLAYNLLYAFTLAAKIL